MFKLMALFVFDHGGCTGSVPDSFWMHCEAGSFVF